MKQRSFGGIFCVSRETLQVLSRGRVGVPVILRQTFFLPPRRLIIIVSHETFAVLTIIDAPWLLQYVENVPSTHFLAFRLFFHLPSPFLPVLLSFAYLSTGDFPCFVCFFVFSFILPQYMHGK